ncbi:MAG: Fe-S cluster domain-containing protein [Bacteroidales bacterium]|nr:Fe-S cluster domain-containing protein [Bacteroidales bacterium]
MNETILFTILSLSGLGAGAAVILYIVAQKFKVIEDPRIDEVEEALPAANCGGCGFAGCRNFAEACVKAENFDGLYCPVGGNDVMASVARILGKEAVEQEPRVAVLRCNGSCEARPKTNIYDGATSCAVASALYGGDTGCQYGCLGFGDCVEVCTFDALSMDPFTGLPVVNDEKCTACGACVKACPKDLFELRKRAKKDRKIYVACRNEEKGGIAKKSCTVACIGCSKCFKVCPYEAIVMENNLAFIDSEKCRLCRKCVTECPTNSIIEIGFPPRKIQDKEETAVGPEGREEKDTNSTINTKEE